MKVVIGLRFVGSSVEICVFIVDKIDYFGCDCMTCYSTCAKGPTFCNFIVVGLGRIMCIIVYCFLFFMWIVMWTFI